MEINDNWGSCNMELQGYFVIPSIILLLKTKNCLVAALLCISPSHRSGKLSITSVVNFVYKITGN